MAKIKLLIVTDEMEVGGTQRQIVRLLSHIDRGRFEPTLVYFRNPSCLLDELANKDIRTRCIAKRKPIDVGFLLDLYRFIKKERFDVVHCFAFTAEWWGAVACTMARVGKLITSIRGTYEWYGKLQWRLMRWVSHRSAAIVSNSRAGAQYAARQMNVEAGTIRIVYNGISEPKPVNAEELHEQRAALGLAASDVVALFVGRLVDHKNIPCLLRAMQLLVQENVKPTLLLAGDGPMRPELEAQAHRIVGARIVFLGERNDVDRLLLAADYVILPSFREGLSNTILEAMIAGKAVIASAVGGNPELIQHEVTGLLFPSDDAQALAESMQRLCQTHELRHTLGKQARQYALDNFSVHSMVCQMESIYEAALAS